MKNAFAEGLKTLSQDDFEAFWPYLAQTGFKASQIKEIVLSREANGLPCDRFQEALDHADAAVKDGLADFQLVYETIRAEGFFERPPGYLSVEERYERDAKLKAEADARARGELEQAHFKLWKLSLSFQEVEAIKTANAPVGLPFLDGVLLREWYRRGKPVLDGQKQLEQTRREHYRLWLSIFKPEEVKMIWQLRGWELPEDFGKE